MKKSICILSFSNIAWDSRVLREIEMARKHFRVDVIGYGDWQAPTGVHFFSLNRKSVFFILKYSLLFGGLIIPELFSIYFWLKPQYQKALTLLKNNHYDLIHANDWDALPVACEYNRFSKAKIIFDAHEYNLDKDKSSVFGFLYQRYFTFLFNKYGDLVNERITVASSIEKLYRKHFDWKFEIIINAPDFTPIYYKPVNPSYIHLVHHGRAAPARNLEEIIDLVKYLDNRYYLHMYLTPSIPGYLESLKKRAGNYSGHVVIHDPVRPKELILEISQYDIGIPLIKADKDSYFYSLPNKFFDYIMAGLMVIVSPLPMMVDMIDKYEVGLYSNAFTLESIAEMVNSLSTNDLNKYKKNSIRASKELNSEIEMKKLFNIYKQLLDVKKN